LPFFFLLLRPTPKSTLFPYTTLFRSPMEHPRMSQNVPAPMTKRDRKNAQPLDRRSGSARPGAHPNNPPGKRPPAPEMAIVEHPTDRKSTRLNSSHVAISYAVFCLKKK